ncbi:hypothetical protein LZ554_002801 [Drepanopeziza brunnea f. sp. 'monogermtubi']|nr:hypothetical protein LZ554_002801 [Drepanopeziza brunnea f. sp. 'monogermtubi']
MESTDADLPHVLQLYIRSGVVQYIQYTPGLSDPQADCLPALRLYPDRAHGHMQTVVGRYSNAREGSHLKLLIEPKEGELEIPPQCNAMGCCLAEYAMEFCIHNDR